MTYWNSIIYNRIVGTQKSEVIILSPRTGRPKSENPKDIDLKIRIDKETNQKILEYCKKHNITRVQAIRNGIDLILENDK